MTRLKTLWMAGGLLVGALGMARAEGMQVEPGKWEFQAVATNTMGAPPQTRTTTECIKESEMTPELFMKESPGCTLSDPKSSSREMSWKLLCANPGGNLEGDARFTSTGKTAEGQLKMSMEIQGGQPLVFEQRWTGKHVGACD